MNVFFIQLKQNRNLASTQLQFYILSSGRFQT